MGNSNMKRLDSPLDHIDRQATVTFAPLPKPRTYSFDLSAYRESVRRLEPAVKSSVKANAPALPAFKAVTLGQGAGATLPRSHVQSPSNYPKLSAPNSASLSQEQSLPVSAKPEPDALSTLPTIHPSQSSLQPQLPVPLTAMNLLRDIEATIIGWQSALHQVLVQIRQLYQEGAMIDGWLESATEEPHGQKLQRVSRDRQQPTPLRQSARGSTSRTVYDHDHAGGHGGEYTPGSTYYVCGYTESGEIWSRPCPPEQIASVSLAISRYQTLQELLRRKRAIEHHLAELAQTILEFHGQVQRIGRRRK